MSAGLRALWRLDPRVTFLNHGSFGACPSAVLAEQQRLRDEIEAEPVAFLGRGIEERLDATRAALASFVGADAEGLAFVPNATTAVNTVLRSLALAPGDELLTTTHVYGACRAALRAVAEEAGARVVEAPVPFPIGSADQVVEAVLAAASRRTRLALLDHVTSPTGLVFPVGRLVPELQARGIDTLVDGAHALGMLPLDLGTLGAAYYTANAHKWLCTPKGAAFLHVRADRRAAARPLVVSHGRLDARTDRSRYRLEFDWTGTDDPTAVLCIPFAIDYLGGLLPGGWPALREANRALALHARYLLCRALDCAPPAPDAMIGALASVPLPDGPAPRPGALDPLQSSLWERERIEVPVWSFPAPPRRLLRVSAQLHNVPEDYERLASALRARTG